MIRMVKEKERIAGNDNLIMYTFDCLNMYNF
ncbi:LysR-family regulatory protein [Staphylococcus aureus]|nr:LysR-family regulatory protein [Staphylococcus aureus]